MGYIAVGIVCLFLGYLFGIIVEERRSRERWTRKLEKAKQVTELVATLSEATGRSKERLERMRAEKVQQ
jgi:predicted house-cleaning noncanonical NTP pyrophosphatase (MazG superfamily)